MAIMGLQKCGMENNLNCMFLQTTKWLWIILILSTGLAPIAYSQELGLALIGGSTVNFQTKQDEQILGYPNLYVWRERISLELTYASDRVENIIFVGAAGYTRFGQLSSLRSDPFVSYFEPTHNITIDFSGIEMSVGIRFLIKEFQRLKLAMGVHLNYIIVNPGSLNEITDGSYTYSSNNSRDIGTVSYIIRTNYLEGFSLGPKFDFLGDIDISKRFKAIINLGFYLGLNHVVDSSLDYQIKFENSSTIVKGDNVTVNKLNYINFGMGLRYEFGN